MCKIISFKVDGRTIRAADIKKDYIVNAADKAKDCAAIDKLVLFGSSTSENCTDRSDIDLAVFGTLSERSMLRSKSYKNFVRELFKYDFNQNYDVLYFDSTRDSDSPILKDIDKGVVLYEKA